MPDFSSRQPAFMSTKRNARELLVSVFVLLFIIGTLGCSGEPESPPTETKPPALSLPESAQTEVDDGSTKQPSPGDEVATDTDMAEDNVPSIAPEVAEKIRQLYSTSPQRPLPSDANAAAGNTIRDVAVHCMKLALRDFGISAIPLAWMWNSSSRMSPKVT